MTIKFSGYRYANACRRINIYKQYEECIPNKPGCVDCLCTSCEHSSGFCLSRKPRFCQPEDINVHYCFYYKSINPGNDGDVPRQEYDYRSKKAYIVAKYRGKS